MADLGELHRRYDGFIPRDEIDRADGLDPALMEALGRVKFWRERVRTPRFAETTHERRVARLQKDQRRVEFLHRPQLAEHPREMLQKTLLAHIDHDRDP